MQENVRSDEDNGNENVVKAFRTILNEILGGELKALQLAVSDLDTQLCRRMQAVEEKTAATSDHLRKELQSLVEERFLMEHTIERYDEIFTSLLPRVRRDRHLRQQQSAAV